MKWEIPRDVRLEAEKGLRWRKKYGRGGTSVGMATARWMVSGRPMPDWKVRHVARYFPRHAWERKLWWVKDEPSNGRIAWALWGGDPGRRWAERIVKRLSRKGGKLGG